MILTTTDKTLIFDESGNLGRRGRYFVISCIETNKPKEIHTIMKKKLLKAKTTFPDINFRGCELKAKDAYPAVKYHILESICKKDVKISYIVLDLNHAGEKFLKEKELLYNYLSSTLINKIIGEDFSGQNLNVWFDNHTTKPHSKDLFKDYIKLELIYRKDFDINVNVEYVNSDATDAYVIQAADYVANAIYTKYEYGIDIYYNLLKEKFNVKEHFPSISFGK